jgi:hypothetical protein
LRAAVRRHYQEHKPDAVPTDDALAILAGAYDAMDSSHGRAPHTAEATAFHGRDGADPPTA